MKPSFTRLGTLAFAAATAWCSPGAALAKPVDVALGVSASWADPNGSGRQAEVQFAGGQAAVTFGSGQFDQQDVNTVGGAVGAFNVMNLRLGSIGGVQPVEGYFPWAGYDESYRGTAGVVGISASSVSVDDLTGEILSVGTTGGFTLTGSRIPGTLTGGEARIENLRFDLANRRVLADLSGTRDAVGSDAAVHFDLPGAVLWSVTSVSGPAFFAPSAILSSNPAFSLAASGFEYMPGSATATGLMPPTASATNTFAGLALTPEAYGFLVDSLGLLSTGKSALRAGNEFGVVQTKVSFALGVPEPETHALMGLGLAMLAYAVQRNKRRKA
jgi:hypothetical protein